MAPAETSAEHIETAASKGPVLYDEVGNLRKIPVPSSDPNDPLNWSARKQFMVLISVFLYGTAGFGVVQATPLLFPTIIADYMKQSRGQWNPAKIGDFATYPSLGMGIGNLLFVPLSMLLGRRYMVIGNNILMLAAIIWAGKSTTPDSHLGARVLQGLSAGLADCLLPIIVLDISFLHRRGVRLGAYWTFTAVGAALLMIPVPYAVASAGANWRVNYWYWTAFSGLSLVFAIFFLPETLFQRPAAAIDGNFVVSDGYGTVRTFATLTEAKEQGFDMKEINEESAGSETETKESLSKQYLPRPQPNGVRNFFHAYLEIAACLLKPTMLWILAFNSVLFSGLVILSIYYAARLEMQPWHFSSSAVGTVQLGSAIGALAALAVSAFTFEPISRFLTRRNGNVRRHEHLLPGFILPSLLCFTGLVVYGTVAGNPASHSWVGVHASYALYYCGFCAISALTGMWIGEYLPHGAGPAIVLACGCRNAVNFGISHSFDKWLDEMGFQNTHILLGGILLILGLGSIPTFFIHKYRK